MAEAAGDAAARLALAVFVRRAAAGIAAAATALDRLDAVVFTGGIGARAGPIRRRILGRLAILGVERDPAFDVEPAADPATADDVSEPRSGPAIARIVAREDVVIAEATVEIAGGGAAR